MTVREMREWLADEAMFFDPEGQVIFKDGDKSLAIDTTTVFGSGDAVVKMKPNTKKRFIYSLKLEANPEIEAETLAEAEAKAIEMMRGLVVGRWEVDKKVFAEDDNFVAQEPYFLEEVKE